MKSTTPWMMRMPGGQAARMISPILLDPTGPLRRVLQRIELGWTGTGSLWHMGQDYGFPLRPALASICGRSTAFFQSDCCFCNNLWRTWRTWALALHRGFRNICWTHSCYVAWQSFKLSWRRHFWTLDSGNPNQSVEKCYPASCGIIDASMTKL